MMDTMTLKERLSFLASPEARDLPLEEFRDSAVLAIADTLQVVVDLEAVNMEDPNGPGELAAAMRPLLTPLELL